MRSLAQATPSIEAHERAGADPRAVCAGPPRPCAVRAGAPHPRAVSAVSAGLPHPRGCTPLGDKVPERQRAFDAVRAGPPSVVQQARELYERHRREDADIRAALRRAWRPPVLHACPTSTPRPREGGARMVAASGRDGSGERDDGSGDGNSGGGGGGGGEPPGPRTHAPFAGGVR